jgi:succinate dehydrogenase / fumarate reductase flavoprotein subunit
MQEMIILIEMMRTGLCHSMYDPKTKTLSKRKVNFAPNQVDAFPPAVRSY